MLKSFCFRNVGMKRAIISKIDLANSLWAFMFQPVFGLLSVGNWKKIRGSKNQKENILKGSIDKIDEDRPRDKDKKKKHSSTKRLLWLRRFNWQGGIFRMQKRFTDQKMISIYSIQSSERPDLYRCNQHLKINCGRRLRLKDRNQQKSHVPAKILKAPVFIFKCERIN